MSKLRKVSEIARCCCREYLRDRLFIFLRDGRVRIEEVAAHILAVSLTRFHCPLMILGCVVHHKIHAQADAFFVAFLRQFGQILHRPEFRLHLTEVSHRITAVGATLRRIKKRHQVDIIYITFFNV